jgi:PP-loop superfamily ATP-utilizing enzyme
MTANRWLNTFPIMGALGAREKEHALIAWMAERRRVAIGFSGGVDSACLAAAEAALRDLGVTGNPRVRHHGDLARVELDPRGFRSGSLNVLNVLNVLGVVESDAPVSGH